MQQRVFLALLSTVLFTVALITSLQAAPAQRVLTLLQTAAAEGRSSGCASCDGLGWVGLGLG
jgi:hypothetical protein